MSRGVLKIENGVASPGSPQGDADDEPRRADLGLPSPGAHERFVARTALKTAATNYAAALLMSHATADHVNRAFTVLEEAAEEFTRVKDHYKEKP